MDVRIIAVKDWLKKLESGEISFLEFSNLVDDCIIEDEIDASCNCQDCKPDTNKVVEMPQKES